MSDHDEALRELWNITRGRPRMRRLIKKAIPPCEQIYAGLRLSLTPGDNYTEFQLWLKGQPPEHAGTTYLADLFAGKNVSIVDVGANAGIFTLPILHRSGPASQGILFEPNPVMRARLEKNIAANDLPEIVVQQTAVSDQPGRLPLYLPANGNLGQARLGIGYSGGNDSFEADVVTLDEALRRTATQSIDLLKVDVEGLEDRVIAPYLSSSDVSRHPRLIYLEDAHSENWKYDLVAELHRYGYQTVSRFGENALYSREADIKAA